LQIVQLIIEIENVWIDDPSDNRAFWHQLVRQLHPFRDQCIVGVDNGNAAAGLRPWSRSGAALARRIQADGIYVLPSDWCVSSHSDRAAMLGSIGAEIESWIKQQKEKPSRSETIRRLIEFALAIKAEKPNTDDKYKIVDNVNDRIDDQAPNVLIWKGKWPVLMGSRSCLLPFHRTLKEAELPFLNVSWVRPRRVWSNVILAIKLERICQCVFRLSAPSWSS
jgi:hypothetical protein